MGRDVYQKLAEHLATLGMGYPPGEELEQILEKNFTPLEAIIALSLPTKVPPFNLASIDEIAQKIDLPKSKLAEVLEDLASRGLLFSGRINDEKKGYALQQMGYGFPQGFFWKGEKTPHTHEMADLIHKYSKAKNVHYEAYATTKTKNYRYIPVKEAIEHDHGMHAVFPFDQMESVIKKARRIAVAHCPCRMVAELRDRKRCDHEMEVCIKYDELADYVLERGMAREISKDEALEIIQKCEDAGLVHMVENAREEIKHTCNCCGCCCWSVGTIRRRRIPRDDLVATYFIRETNRDLCTGCGECVDICPVDAIAMDGDFPNVDREWCIGCGLCLKPCPTSAAILKRKTANIPPKDFESLSRGILQDKGFK
jgi:NAD-dependent dihydropyrimidine dehydrogenase PreA subunit